MTEEKRLAKNKKIAETKQATLARHSSMLCKTYEVKIQWNKCSKEQKEALQRVFLEAKWFKNYVLNWSEKSSENKIVKFDTKIKEITKKNAKFEDEQVKLKYLSAQSKVCIINQICANIKTLHTLKTKGFQKPGKLKFSKEERSLNFIQANSSYKIKSSKRLKLQNLGKAFPVNGLGQFISISGIEFANAKLIHKATGYFIQIVTYQPKEIKQKEKIKETLGIDFGCSTTFTLSTGEKISCKIPESERLKRLQKQQAKKVKGSKNFQKAVAKVRKEYQKITNRKEDISNKLVHKFCQYETIVIQDEQLKSWHSNGHGKAIQHSVLGKVKYKLKQKENVVILSKTAPTTKLCTNCGEYHDELKIYDRLFKCSCGVCEDRDVHAAKNMVWMFNHSVGVEHTKVTRIEMKALANRIYNSVSQLLSTKYEAVGF